MQSSAASQALPQSNLYVVDPNLRLPYTGEWNIALEQQLFGDSTVSVTYVGGDGDKLASSITSYGLSSALVTPTGYLQLLTNRGRSNYQGLQIQSTVRVKATVDGILAYTYSHNIDNGSSDFSGPLTNATNYRASADDDLRNVFAAGLSFRSSGYGNNKMLHVFTKNWVLNNFVRLQYASPFSVTANDENATVAQLNSIVGFADRVPGVPVYLRGGIATNGKLAPGGIQLNPAAFQNPPSDSTGSFLRDGNSGRNAYRLFGLKEFDLAAGRKVALTDRVALEFKAEVFNVLNTANFAKPVSTIGQSNFGLAQNTYAGNAGGSGGLNSAFQIGGPRNLQLTLRVVF